MSFTTYCLPLSLPFFEGLENHLLKKDCWTIDYSLINNVPIYHWLVNDDKLHVYEGPRSNNCSFS